ncbi:A/B superfamily hydrolase [Rhodotorula taiwanensis]|uniref:A/B superfamily hydrolase n=1 Tax=Rhodotorula taiwanensis TaxID=741276 RepID=A0A2S5BI43_9BASI|nr:A/B superfamily hydrolase [Rhodotorula taiwanensis]
MGELSVIPVQATASHPAPQLQQVDRKLRSEYSRPRDGNVESNLLILLHGLGDTAKPFAHLGQSLNLPQTAVLALQAPARIPLLEEEAYQWWDSFDHLGEVIQNPNPTETLALLTKVLEHLVAPPTAVPPGCGWLPSQIHLFGFAQGASCAGELALAWSRSRPAAEHLASLVSVSAPLLSHPTLSTPAATKVGLVFRSGEERATGAASWRKGFKDVREIKLPGGRGREGMPRGMDEWRDIMRFWSEVLIRRSALEFGKDVYEVTGGVAAAQQAGPQPQP